MKHEDNFRVTCYTKLILFDGDKLNFKGAM